MATTAGITQVASTAGAWVQLASQACTQIIFQKGNFDFATSATPGNNFLHVDRSSPNLTIPVVANANTLWIRSNSPVTFLWSS